MDAETAERQVPVEDPEELPSLEEFTSYDDDGALVVCSTTNPNAWIRSDVVRDQEV